MFEKFFKKTPGDAHFTAALIMLCVAAILGVYIMSNMGNIFYAGSSEAVTSSANIFHNNGTKIDDDSASISWKP